MVIFIRPNQETKYFVLYLYIRQKISILPILLTIFVLKDTNNTFEQFTSWCQVDLLSPWKHQTNSKSLTIKSCFKAILLLITYILSMSSYASAGKLNGLLKITKVRVWCLNFIMNKFEWRSTWLARHSQETVVTVILAFFNCNKLNWMVDISRPMYRCIGKISMEYFDTKISMY